MRLIDKTLTESVYTTVSESASGSENFIQLLNRYRDEYSFGHADNDSYIAASVTNLLRELPSGSAFYTNYKETVSGYTSFGGYNHEYAKITEYKKEGNEWKRNGTVVDIDDVRIGVLHSSSEIRTKEEAEKAQEEMKKETKSSHTPYAPKSSVDPDNPYWDGNRYGI